MGGSVSVAISEDVSVLVVQILDRCPGVGCRLPMIVFLPGYDGIISLLSASDGDKDEEQ